MLNATEEKVILQGIQNGDRDSKEAILQNNLGLLYKYTRRYSPQYSQDIFQEAAIAFLHAATRYEFDRGTKFSTYATFWIMQAANRGYQKLVRDVRLPSNILENVQKIKRAITFHMTEFHCEPDLEELSRITGIPAAKIEYYKMFATNSSSLDMIVDDNNSTLGSYIEDKNNPRFEDKLDEQEMDNCLYDALDELSSREKFIIERHFGLKELEPMSLTEIARLLQVSRERIRQIKERSIKKIKEKYGDTLTVYL